MPLVVPFLDEGKQGTNGAAPTEEQQRQQQQGQKEIQGEGHHIPFQGHRGGGAAFQHLPGGPGQPNPFTQSANGGLINNLPREEAQSLYTDGKEHSSSNPQAYTNTGLFQSADGSQLNKQAREEAQKHKDK